MLLSASSIDGHQPPHPTNLIPSSSPSSSSPSPSSSSPSPSSLSFSSSIILPNRFILPNPISSSKSPIIDPPSPFALLILIAKPAPTHSYPIQLTDSIGFNHLNHPSTPFAAPHPHRKKIRPRRRSIDKIRPRAFILANSSLSFTIKIVGVIV